MFILSISLICLSVHLLTLILSHNQKWESLNRNTSRVSECFEHCTNEYDNVFVCLKNTKFEEKKTLWINQSASRTKSLPKGKKNTTHPAKNHSAKKRENRPKTTVKKKWHKINKVTNKVKMFCMQTCFAHQPPQLSAASNDDHRCCRCYRHHHQTKRKIDHNQTLPNVECVCI